MRSSKRLLAMLSAGVAFATVLTACGGDNSAAGGDSSAQLPTNAEEVDATIDTSKVKKDIVVAVDNPYYLFHEDVLVAQDKGYFKEVGIDNVKIVTVEDPLPALIGGSVDFALYDTDTAIAAAKKSNAGVRYMSVYLGGEANILGVRKGINTAEDLKGKTITGGQFGSRNDFLIRKLLTDNGINPDTGRQAGEHRRPVQRAPAVGDRGHGRRCEPSDSAQDTVGGRGRQVPLPGARAGPAERLGGQQDPDREPRDRGRLPDRDAARHASSSTTSTTRMPCWT